jgi:hypothetical protein
MLNTTLHYDHNEDGSVTTYAIDENETRWYLRELHGCSSGKLPTGETVYKTAYRFTRTAEEPVTSGFDTIDFAYAQRHY